MHADFVLQRKSKHLKGTFTLPDASDGKESAQVQPLGREDSLEKEMATHSSILAWRMAWTEEPGGPQFMGSQELDTTYSAIFSLFFFIYIKYTNFLLNLYAENNFSTLLLSVHFNYALRYRNMILVVILLIFSLIIFSPA